MSYSSFREGKLVALATRLDIARNIIRDLQSEDKDLSNYLGPLERETQKLKEKLSRTKADFNLYDDMFGSLVESDTYDTAARTQLSEIFKSMSNIEEGLYVRVDPWLSYFIAWLSQRSNPIVSSNHSMLSRFVQQGSSLTHLGEQPLAIFQDEYATWTFAEEGISYLHGLTVPVSEKDSPASWVTLAHEFGHVYYDRNVDSLKDLVKDPIGQALRSIQESDNKFMDTARDTWLTNWVPELVADCFAVKNTGPCYVSQFLKDAVDGIPTYVDLDPTHPPMVLRAQLQIQALKELDLSGIVVGDYERTWQSYIQAISYQTEPTVQNVLLDSRVVETAIKSVVNAIDSKLKDSIWEEMLVVKDKLQRGEKVKENELFCALCIFNLLPNNIPPNVLINALDWKDTTVDSS